MSPTVTLHVYISMTFICQVIAGLEIFLFVMMPRLGVGIRVRDSEGRCVSSKEPELGGGQEKATDDQRLKDVSQVQREL